jgi:hypothetical protein
MTAPYFLARWTGRVLDPIARDLLALADELEPGRVYRICRYEERSPESHNHQFAEVHETWQNLPDHLRQQFPSPDHLRKHALIRAGFCNARQFVCSSKAEALRLAPFLRAFDEYSLVVVCGSTVNVLTAHSQSKRAMGKARFQQSKNAVLAFCAELIGTTPETLSRETGRAA